MVAGIVLFALGLKKTLADVDDPLKIVPATGLVEGLALYLLAHVLLRLRISRLAGRGSIGRGKPAAFVALVVFWPFADNVPSLVALAFSAVVLVALIAYEAIRYREPRALIRHGTVVTDEMMAGARLARRADS
jgi:hypothetical protein